MTAIWEGVAWVIGGLLLVALLGAAFIAAQARGLRNAARDTDETYTPPRQPHRTTRGPGRSGTQDPARPAPTIRRKGRQDMSDRIDIEMVEHARTEFAVLVSDTGEECNAVWLPLSQVEVARRETAELVMGGAPVTVTAPEWLAAERGLI